MTWLTRTWPYLDVLLFVGAVTLYIAGPYLIIKGSTNVWFVVGGSIAIIVAFAFMGLFIHLCNVSQNLELDLEASLPPLTDSDSSREGNDTEITATSISEPEDLE